MSRYLWVLLAAALTSCGSGVSGNYGGDQCLFDKLSFKGDNVVYVTFMGTESAGTYKIDGDRVVVAGGNGESIVFTRNGSKLEAGMMGDKMICEKL